MHLHDFDAFNWFWFVGDDHTRYWSSAASSWTETVPEDAGISRANTVDALDQALRTYGLLGPLGISKADVKAEAARRIELILPDWKQRNTLAMGQEAIMAHGPDPSIWPLELRAALTAANAAWATIKALRLRSDEIELMDPIPLDFRQDGYWPALPLAE